MGFVGVEVVFREVFEMRSLGWKYGVWCVLVWVGWSVQAEAAGLWITKDPQRQVRVRGMRVLSHFTRDQLALHVQVAVQSDDTEVAWMLPIPLEDTKGLGVLISSTDRMKSLEKLTAPIIELNSINQRTGCGRPSAHSITAPENAPISLGQLFDAPKLSLQPADVSYSSDGKVEPLAQMLGWLQQQGFALSSSQEAQVKAISAQQRTQWIFARLRTSGKSEIQAVEPLLVRLPRPTYQDWTHRLSLSPHDGDVPAVFWTIGRARYAITNKAFTEKSLEEIGRVVRQQFDAEGKGSYEGALRDQTKAAQTGLFVPEFKQDLLKLCPREIPDDDPNYAFCQEFQEIVSMAESGYSVLTRLRVRLQGTGALPDIEIGSESVDQSDITGRVLASAGGGVFSGVLIAAVMPMNRPFGTFKPYERRFEQHQTIRWSPSLGASSLSQVALLWVFGLFGLWAIRRKRNWL